MRIGRKDMPKFKKPETDIFYIMKANDRNENEKLAEYLKQMALFRGNMDMMGNSIEIILNGILEKIGIRPELTLGRKIEQLETNKSKLTNIMNFDDLVQKLRGFNENWKITKHGLTLMGETIKDITFFKDDGLYIFDENEIEEMKQVFTQIQEALTKIHNPNRGSKQALHVSS